jgi:hypothetical protein
MRRLLKDGEHLVRLALLGAAGLVVFLLVRALLVPPTYGELGAFRAAALDDVRAHAPAFAGRTACVACHGEQAKGLAGGHHAKLGCETCHGPLAAHAAKPDAVKPEAPDVVPLCSRCHAANQARPKTQPQVDPVAHAEGNACTDCHDPHAPAL